MAFHLLSLFRIVLRLVIEKAGGSAFLSVLFKLNENLEKNFGAISLDSVVEGGDETLEDNHLMIFSRWKCQAYSLTLPFC